MPFHQWMPDVYEGAPTPDDRVHVGGDEGGRLRRAAAALRRGADGAASTWAPAFAALAAFTIVIGNVGALGQSSLKRMLAYSSVAQAGYMLVGVVVSTRLGVQATIFYLGAYLVMNIAAFAVIAVRERRDGHRATTSPRCTGSARPGRQLAWPMTIAMLSLAGFPATAGFFGKLFLIQAAVDNEYAWLGVAIVLGSGHLARLLPAGHRGGLDALALRESSRGSRLGGGAPRPVIAGGSPEADEPARTRPARATARSRARARERRAARTASAASARRRPRRRGQGPAEGDAPPGEGPRERIGAEDEGTPSRRRQRGALRRGRGGRRARCAGIRTHQYEVAFVALLCAVVTVALGVYPDPLLDLARDAADSIRSLV